MRLTKSLVAAFDQCPKRLWLEVHRGVPEMEDPHGDLRKAEGERVGAIARSLFPDGRLVPPFIPLDAAIAEMRNLLAANEPCPIFEAAFFHQDTYVRVDILAPLPDGSWHLIEVKSAASLKDHYVGDLATQVHVARGAGLPVGKASIWHIDSSFVLTVPGDYRGLFVERTEIDGLDQALALRAQEISEAVGTFEGAEPEIKMGNQCITPYECPFQDYCASSLPAPPEWPTSLLPAAAGKKAAVALAEQGIVDLTTVPPGHFGNERLQRIHQATISGTPHHDMDAIRNKTAAWRYPLHFLDFETIQFAAPRWIGTKAHAQIPFQFSDHILSNDGTLSHGEFLDVTGEDPRRACAEALVNILCVPDAAGGSVVTYFAGFEKECIKALARAFGDLREDLLALHDRVVDLLPIVREHYYHRDQRGSWSIKAVLPTICPELSYSDLEVKDGTNAQAAYIKVIDHDVTPGEKAAIIDALKAYCRRDTLAMVKLVSALT